MREKRNRRREAGTKTKNQKSGNLAGCDTDAKEANRRGGTARLECGTEPEGVRMSSIIEYESLTRRD
jgi:hypothetical protein